MSNKSIKDFNKHWWNETYNRIIGAVVFIDDSSAECLHWDGGLFNLFEGGAAAVKPISPFEYAPHNQCKSVFITEASKLRWESIKEIIKNSNFSHCIVISTVALEIVYSELFPEKNININNLSTMQNVVSVINKELEAMVTSWMDKKQTSVEVVHIPTFAISLTNNIYLTPAYDKLYPNFKDSIIPEPGINLDLYSLSDDVRLTVRRLASNFNSMFESMNIKEDIFYMGAFSSLVAGILVHSPICSARRKVCTMPASLIFIDRTLDLCGITSHSSESLLDKIKNALEKLPGHSLDVAVNMSMISDANVVSPHEDIELSPGCLFHSKDESCQQTFDHMIHKTQKEVMFDLHNKLSKLDLCTSPGPKVLARVTTQSLEKIMTPVKGRYEIISNHLGLLQQSLAVVQTLKSKKLSMYELMCGLERQALESITTSRESTSILNQLSHIIKNRKQRELLLIEILSLVIYVYSLASGDDITFAEQHQNNLVTVLSQALHEDQNELYDNELGSSHYSMEECEKIAKNMVNRLKDVCSLKKYLKRYNSVLKPSESGTSIEYKGLLQQFIEDLVNTKKPDVVDLKYRNDGIKDLLKSGLSILTSMKPRSGKHPLDNQTIYIYVIGGITAEECKLIHRCVITSGTDAVVYIGSNKLVNTKDAVKDFFQIG